jgi:Mg2+-importing ATPase
VDENVAAFCSVSHKELLKQIVSSKNGLTEEEAQRRFNQHGPNTIEAKNSTTTLTLLLIQFKSPIILILLIETMLSLIVCDKTDAIIILSIVMISSFLGFLQEKSAGNAVEKLLAFQPVPFLFLLALGGIVLIYIIVAEATKKLFCKRMRSS